MVNLYAINTLKYDRELCNNCGMCTTVCPHGVFEQGANKAELANPEACMECGACQKNCPTGALTVDSGVGCAAAMIMAALTGRKEAICGPSDCCDPAQPGSQESVCCGPAGKGDSLDGTGPAATKSQTSSCCGSGGASGSPQPKSAPKSQSLPCCGSSPQAGKG
jgi:NAD-dependent dihydropyrimidine dehydrogenase PreA subunit